MAISDITIEEYANGRGIYVSLPLDEVPLSYDEALYLARQLEKICARHIPEMIDGQDQNKTRPEEGMKQ